MRKKKSKNSVADRWDGAHDGMQKLFPQLTSVWLNDADFISLLLKVKDDGTVLAVLKQYGPDGAPTVCFGSGYGPVGCLLGLEGTIAAGKWRNDKPYSK